MLEFILHCLFANLCPLCPLCPPLVYFATSMKTQLLEDLPHVRKILSLLVSVVIVLYIT